MRLRRFIVMAVLLSFSAALTRAQDTPKPLGLPVSLPPGPSTWLLGQPYGNTVGAFNFGTAWYSAGQGLHFGIDISMPCGTPLVAVADGDVIYVDNLTFGAGPHNLILRHEAEGITTLYGHLLNAPPLSQFQRVKKGDPVGFSGDPDVTCDSRPHLHFEVRSLDYRTAYNPIDYIDAPWHVLASIGSFDSRSFQIDLTDPRRWVSIDDQPPVAFGGARLNAYTQTWPPPQAERPPVSVPLPREVPAMADIPWTMRPLTVEGCCAAAWWHPLDASRLYMVDGSPGLLAGIFEWDVNVGGLFNLAGDAPPPLLSPDGSHQIIRTGAQISIRRLSDQSEWVVNTAGATPSISSDNRRLLWLVQNGQFVPGARPPLVEVWVSDLDGANARQIVAQPRAAAQWLDEARLLISVQERTLTTLSVFDTRDGSSFTLGTWDRLRGLSAAPGGERVLFYQTYQQDAEQNGVYALDMTSGAAPQKLPWFGGWRWRDGESVYYVPLDSTQSLQTLAYYHIPSGENRLLTDPAAAPIMIANGDWSVSADGRRIAFMNAADRRLWILEQAG